MKVTPPQIAIHMLLSSQHNAHKLVHFDPNFLPSFVANSIIKYLTLYIILMLPKHTCYSIIIKL